jgi:hypothetical protein
MGEPQYVKGGCKKCGGHIEFPALGLGQTVNCPHCGKRTKLHADDESFSKLKIWKYHGICISCGVAYNIETPEELTVKQCDKCNMMVSLKEGPLPEALDPLNSSPCPKCRKPVLDTQTSCPHCYTKLIPTLCPYCGCRELRLVTPRKPVLFAPLSFTGILLSVGASVAADAIFEDEYYCINCARRCK